MEVVRDRHPFGAARPGITFGTVSSLDEAKEQLAAAWRKRIAEEGNAGALSAAQ